MTRIPPPVQTPQVFIATNNGDIGGGEVMLLNIAVALTQLGTEVSVIGPRSPGALVSQARSLSLNTIEFDAHSRLGWMRALRSWDSGRTSGVLWCNGLVPAVATMRRKKRIVHLHQEPRGLLKMLANPARRGAILTLVPSHFMTTRVRGSRALSNWVEEVQITPRLREPGRPTIIGFLGRPSLDKGVDVLAGALQILDSQCPGEFRLLLAGEPRFVDAKQRQAVERALSPIRHLTDAPGWLVPNDFFSAIDLFVCPSVWQEPFGLVAAEAMSGGIPLLVSDAGALPEVVGNDASVIFPAGDAQTLAQRILEWRAARNPETQFHLHQRWKDHYSPAAGLRNLATLLHEVL
jgi:glycosyltransferase involved in cell wall biosynthesis